MPAIVYEEWLNQNAYRAYPFAENSQRYPVDQTGTLIEDAQLPNYVIVDFVFAMPGAVDARLYLSQFAIVGNLLSLVFAETLTGSNVTTVAVDLNTHTANQGYLLVGMGDWSDGRGRVVIGDLRNLATDLADGLYTYAADQTTLEACVVRPTVRGVRSLQIQNGDNLSELISGNIKLVAGSNVSLTYDSTNNAIWIHAVANADYQQPCDCADDSAQTNVVRTLNGIPLADAVLEGDGSCIRVETSGNRIVISDICSEPCCGCPELQYLTESLKIMDMSLSKLEEYSQRLAQQIEDFRTNYVLTLGT